MGRRTLSSFPKVHNISIIIVVVVVVVLIIVVVIIPIIRYGHTCLLTEVAGTRGIMVAGGALAGKQVLVIIMMTMMMMTMVMMTMTMVMIMMMTVVVGGALADKQVLMIMDQGPDLSLFKISEF